MATSNFNAQITVPHMSNTGHLKLADSGIGNTQCTTFTTSSSSNSGSTSTKSSPEQANPSLVCPQTTSTPNTRRHRLLSSCEDHDTTRPIAAATNATPIHKIFIDQLSCNHDINVTQSLVKAIPTENTPKNPPSPETQPLAVVKPKQRRIHRCEYCDKEFDRPSLLKRHTLSHTGERPFMCKFCVKSFSTRSAVNTHERIHTGQKPYSCSICGRRFAAGSNLIVHKYIHTDNKRHQCSYCPKNYVTPGDLRKHEYTHTGAWPFTCSACKRGFPTERALQLHDVTHSGRKPYTCKLCPKSYAQGNSLKNHLRKHEATQICGKSCTQVDLCVLPHSRSDTPERPISWATRKPTPAFTASIPTESSQLPPSSLASFSQPCPPNALASYLYYCNLVMHSFRPNGSSDLQLPSWNHEAPWYKFHSLYRHYLGNYLPDALNPNNCLLTPNSPFQSDQTCALDLSMKKTLS